MQVRRPTDEEMLAEIATLRAVVTTKKERSETRPIEAQIEAIEHHMKDEVPLWDRLGKFNKFICLMGLMPVCQSDRHYNRYGEALMGKAVHGWFDTPVSGCSCGHCEHVAKAITLACDWIAGLGPTPTVANAEVESRAAEEAKKLDAESA
jgi:hypothetical protein